MLLFAISMYRTTSITDLSTLDAKLKEMELQLHSIKDRLRDETLTIPILLFKGLPMFGFLIFIFKNALIPLCLSRDKTKGQFGKNATLTLTKTLPKKLDYSPVKF